MRRFRAMLLLAVFSFTLIGPALLATDSDSGLPACCRRDGNHRCGMLESRVRSSQSGPAWKASVCPSFPAVKGLPVERTAVAQRASEWNFEAVTAEPAARPRSAPAYRAAYDRDFPKRGPPTQA